MSTTYEPGKPWQIMHGDVQRVAKTMLPANYFHAMLGDAPYGYRFMGRRWDYNVPSPMLWSACERVLRPGAYGMIFGGPRTFHRVAIGMEDGGFGIEDLIMWLHGSGFPKSTNVSKEIDRVAGATRKVIGQRHDGAGNGSVVGLGSKRVMKTSYDITAPATLLAQRWDGFGTQLKPGYEPVLLVQKYTEEIIARNVALYGVGGLDIAASRIGDGSDIATIGEPATVGRWPANVVLSHDIECTDDACASECPVAMIDAQSGNRPGMSSGGTGRRDASMFGVGGITKPETVRGDNGGASRFYYTAKADRYQRDAGCEELPEHAAMHGKASKGGGLGVSASKNPVRNTHPTVKPIDLIRYLAKMILPPPGDEPRRILVPFSGSGSEMIGCLQAGWDEVVGIEREAEYITFANARITRGGVFSGLADKRMRRRKAAR